MIELRPYQREAVDAVYHYYLREHEDNPCVVLPTASGKTACMATICRDAVGHWNGRVLVLAHMKELLEQTAGTLQHMALDLPVGIFSAGLGRRDVGYCRRSAAMPATLNSSADHLHSTARGLAPRRAQTRTLYAMHEAGTVEQFGRGL